MTDQIVLDEVFLVLLETNVESLNLIVFGEIVIDGNVKCKNEVVEDIFIIHIGIVSIDGYPNYGVNDVE